MAKQRFTSASTEERLKTCLEEFQVYLEFHNKSPNTIRAYLFAVRQFFELYPAMNLENLILYKCYLIDHYKPQTVNLRIRAMNCLVEFLDLPYSKVPMVKHRNRSFLENVISLADYEYLKNCLLRDGKLNYYFAIRLMAGTGLRISELVQLQAENIWLGYIDLHSKGNRMRRVYIPKSIRYPCLKWLRESGRTTGDVFLNRFGQRITANGIRIQLNHFATIYNLNPSVLHPHSFRHLFAKNFIERCSDIAMLSDILGHESIETTRIYLHRSSTEQQQIFNRVVNW
ncbi:MAG: tyrosine-type recombinase/integrase [Lachnospiraceae bacterium]|nr:tyrosine-type recombinase/integrase [Lachnospiraceae bacterium]